VTFKTYFHSLISLLYPTTTLCVTMKKLTLLYIAAFLALTLGLMLSCSKKDGSSSSSSSSSSEETDTSSSQTVTLSTSIAFGNAQFGDAKFQ